MDSSEKLAKVLDVEPKVLEELDELMKRKTGRTGVLDKVAEAGEEKVSATLSALGVKEKNVENIRASLREAIYEDEQEFLGALQGVSGETLLEKAARFAENVSSVENGFFLKKDRAVEILRMREPKNLLAFLGTKSVDELLEKYDVTEAFSALRFMETDKWMHETFDEAYSNFTEDDFEERPIEVRALGDEWEEVGKKFIAKKHHNVSHLKEFGVIFLNPVAQDVPGKFLRDFALIFHYLHEISFYSRMFRRAMEGARFGEEFKSLLRSDVPDKKSVGMGEWLIIQRYLFKDNPRDPRLYLPRVNPESIHWMRGERDITNYRDPKRSFDLSMWHDCDWVAGIFDGELVSFDMEDNAMSAVSHKEGKNSEFFFYHQREALWTKLFMEYAGGEDEMEKLVIDNFSKAAVVF